MDANFSVAPHDDGTVSLSHFGTRYHHWWLADLKKRRGDLRKCKGGVFIARILGKTGGESEIVLTAAEAEALKEAVAMAKDLAAAATPVPDTGSLKAELERRFPGSPSRRPKSNGRPGSCARSLPPRSLSGGTRPWAARASRR